MSASAYAYQHYLLNSISDELQSQPAKRIAQGPGIQSVYRVICYRPDKTLPDSVAVLISSIAGEPTLTVHYTGDISPLETTLPKETVRGLAAAFSAAKFDRLSDQPDIPTQGVTLWLIERAAGSFAKQVLVAPESADGQHAALVARLREHLSPAVEQPQRQ